jgi:hypothetical protein
MPDFRTIADFRKNNGTAIREVCREFVVLCRRLELFNEASVAIDGSKFKAVNSTVPPHDHFPPLDYLEFDHVTVESRGIASDTAEALGIGYAPKGAS